MAYLAVVASHTVNGVAAIHSDIIRETIFKVPCPAVCSPGLHLTGQRTHLLTACDLAYGAAGQLPASLTEGPTCHNSTLRA